MASATHSTALALSAFAQIDSQNPITDKIAAWLIAHKRPQGWGNTNATSFSILALTDYLLAKQQNTSQAVAVQIQINGQPFTTATITPRQGRQVIHISAQDLPNGASLLTLQANPPQPVYYQIRTQLYSDQTTIPAAGNIAIVRTYTDPKTNQPITAAQVGQIVRVELKVTTPTAAAYLLLEDHLPSGLEAINERLNTTSATYRNLNDPYDYSLSYWEEYGYNYKQIHGTRVTFFITNVPAGGKVITYLV